jgi:hypothetical protein
MIDLPNASTFAAVLSKRRFIAAAAIAAIAGAARGFAGFGSALIYVPLISAVYEPRIAAEPPPDRCRDRSALWRASLSAMRLARRGPHRGRGPRPASARNFSTPRRRSDRDALVYRRPRAFCVALTRGRLALSWQAEIADLACRRRHRRVHQRRGADRRSAFPTRCFFCSGRSCSIARRKNSTAGYLTR